MLIKSADDKTKRLALLEDLQKSTLLDTRQKEWLRDELGPEAVLANHLQRAIKAIGDLPDLLRRIEAAYPKPGAAPPAPPLPEIEVGPRRWLTSLGWSLLGALAGVAVASVLYGGV